MSDHDDDLPRNPLLPTARALEVLQCGVIDTEFGALRWSSNYAFLVALTHEDTRVIAVYKPQRGERPLWDFPDGTLCHRETASFLTSQQLGWQIVPPTVLRQGARGLGTMQFFIDHDPNINYFSFDETAAPQLRRFALFDYLVNNADRKGGHCLLDETGHIWGIDHGITFNAVHKLRTVIWDFAGEFIEPDLLAQVAQLESVLDNVECDFTQRIRDLLAEAEIKAFRNRIRRILKTGKYPQPGSGPNYPWPPV